MARALTLAEVRTAFKTWGVPFTEAAGCATRSNGSSWNGVTGCMFHHTAMDASDAVNLRVLINGHSSLSGPLCNFGVGDDGVVDIVALGPANHAGKGDPDTLRKVQTENYTGDIKPDQNSQSPGAIGGNSRFYGWEVYYGAGTDKVIDPIQYRGTILSQAAITWALDRVDGPDVRWSAKSTIGHKEWTNWKPDPAGVSMSSARADIQWCLDNGPAKAKAWYLTGSKVASPVVTPPPVINVPPPVVVKPPVLVTPVNLVVDGRFGPSTKKALQRLLKIAQTGLWNSTTIRATQKWLGVTVDGQFGFKSKCALQKRVGAKVDGDWGPNTTMALQRYLNAR